MRILVLGSGAREHAIITALVNESRVADAAPHDITAAPGNAGIALEVPTVALDVTQGELVADYAVDHGVELVVIGPEAPLIAGVADAVRRRGIAVFGPDAAAAQLEGSKAFAKRIMAAAGVPTGRGMRAESLAEAEAAFDAFGAPYVVKADGLAAGKGVLVTDDRAAALAHAEHYLLQGGLLIEEFLAGHEVSLFVLSDGHHVIPLSPAQDYKRLGVGDLGPNTGGMGAYSPLPWLPEGFVDEVVRTVAEPTVRQLEREGTPFVGLLYCGLIVTEMGIRVIEFNARFGDPETQVVLPRLITPLSELLLAASTGRLAGVSAAQFSDDVAVAVVLASEGYPVTSAPTRLITGLEAATSVPGVTLTHAATARTEEGFVATGGRVLSVVATAASFAQARARAYEALGNINLEGGQFRSDIASRVL